MNELIKVIKQDRIQAMKDRDDVKKNLLSTLVGDATKLNKEPKDSEVIAVIRKFIKNSEITHEHLVNKQNSLTPITKQMKTIDDEIEILNGYLPKQLNTIDIADIIKVCKQNGNTTMGEIMKYFKENFEGQYNGAAVSKMIKEILN